MIRLSFEQGRVIGAMVEKAMTTPANYPMSLNAVMIACNQVSNRDPITQLTEDEIELILRGLADDGLVKMVHRPGDRVVKYRQAFDEKFGTNDKETAILGVLLLRGAQTPGELRQRTTRYVEFVSLPELEEVLGQLTARGLASRLDRQPGQKESRYEQLVTTDGLADATAAVTAAESADPTSHDAMAEPTPDEAHQPSRLESEVDDLRRRFEELLDRLGEEIP